MHGTEGNSGSPIVNLTDGTVAGVFKSASRSSNFDTYGTPAPHLVRLMDRPVEPEASVEASAVHTETNYTIDNPAAAMTNLNSLFGSDFLTDRPADFFHSKVKSLPIQLEDGEHKLTMKMQLLPADGAVVVNPIALDGQPLSSDVHWPGSNIPVQSAQLSVSLDNEGMPVQMTAYNDPDATLPKAFNYRGDNNYLANLKPSAVKS